MDHANGSVIPDGNDSISIPTSSGSRVGRANHERKQPTRLVNRFQPSHKFLDQLVTKSPMCLVNEICRYHNLKLDYTLLQTTGPEHAKRFYVSLQFGQSEKFFGDGSSIKNAQRNAAISALQNTQLSFPRAQHGNNNRSVINSSHSGLVQTPASELNTLLMKRGIQPKYELTAEKITNEDLLIPVNGMQQQQLNIANQQNFYSQPKIAMPFQSGYHHHHHHQVKANGKINGNLDPKFYPWPIHMMPPATYGPNGFVFWPYPQYQQYSPTAAHTSTCIRPPNQHSQQHGFLPYSARTHFPSQFPSLNNSNFYSGFNPTQFNSYPASMKSTTQNVNKWNFYSQNCLLPLHYQLNGSFSNNNNKNSTNFEAKVEFEGQQFSGQGRTAQAARHSAANEALKYVKSQPKTSDNYINKKNKKRGNATSQTTSSSSENDDQSPISLVYEIASRHRFKVLFELIRETGQIHMPQFLMRCSLYTDNPKQPYLTAEGEDRSKKAAKKVAAQTMLSAMKQKQMHNASHDTSQQAYSKNVLLRPRQSNEQSTTNEQTNSVLPPESSIPCKYNTLLYQLTRNMLLQNPSFLTSSMAEDDPMVKEFTATLTDNQSDSLSPVKLFKTECILTFEQRLPQQLTCLVKSVGFGSTFRMAKSIATYICLLKIGIKLPAIDSTESSNFTKALQFSLARNFNVPKLMPVDHVEAFEPEVEQKSDFTQNSSPETVKDDDDDDGSDAKWKHLPPDVLINIEQNLQFIIHILGKLYLFTLKDPSKSTDRIFDKLESTLKTFYANKYPETSSDQVDNKCTLLKKMMADLDGSKYWSHLMLISSLVTLGIELDQSLCKEPLLHFKPHHFESEFQQQQQQQQQPNISHHISIISGHCNPFISQTFKLTLIKKNFVNYGVGTCEDKAKEMASFWTLKNLSYLARKQMIDNEFEEDETIVTAINQCNLTTNENSSSGSNNNNNQTSAGGKGSSQIGGPQRKAARKSKSRSTSSQGQLISKHCISRLFQACADLNIRKPNFECNPWSLEQSPEILKLSEIQPHLAATNLFRAECVLSFIQEVPEAYSTKLAFSAIAPTQRLARTICAYIVLCKLGLSPSVNWVELFKLEHFETYLRLSTCNEPTLSMCNPIRSLSESAIQLDSKRLVAENAEEIGRNLEFVVRILQDIYRPFLRNHKMACPSHLLDRVQQELFEYHNHQQQIMDQSTTFDRCSEHIEQCIGNLISQFDGSQFWHHLQLLSSIASLLTSNLAQPITPAVLEFKCQMSVTTRAINPQTNANSQCDSSNNSSSCSVPVAVITVHTSLPNSSDLTSKSFLSFAMSQDENMAREIASYKALRHLAINLWK